MNLQEFASHAQASGMIVVDEMAYGEVQGYPFAIKAKGKDIRCMNISYKVEDRVPAKVIKNIKNTIKMQGITGCNVYFINNNRQMIGVTCAGAETTLWNHVFAILSIVAKSLAEQGIRVPNVCPICKQGLCDSLADVGGAYVPVHKQCCENMSYNTMAATEANQNSGNMAVGILGAIIGGTIAAIPTILTIVYMEMIFAILYALIPLGAYHGYRLCKGKMNKAVLGIVIVIAVLEIFVVQQTLWYISVVEYYGIWPNVIETIVSFYEWITLDELIADLAQPAIFTALGIYISYGQIRQNNLTQERRAHVVLRSLYVKNSAVLNLNEKLE